MESSDVQPIERTSPRRQSPSARRAFRRWNRDQSRPDVSLGESSGPQETTTASVPRDQPESISSELGPRVFIETTNSRFLGRLVCKPGRKNYFVLNKVTGKDVKNRWQVLVQYDPSPIGMEQYDNHREFVFLSKIKDPKADSTSNGRRPKRKAAGGDTTDYVTERLIQKILRGANGCLAGLSDYGHMGLRGLPSNGISDIHEGKTRASSRTLRTVTWDSSYAPDASNPTFFKRKAWTSKEEAKFREFTDELIVQMLQKAQKRPKAPQYLSKGPEEGGTPGYWKAHLCRETALEVLSQLVPPSLQVKRSSSIAFLNLKTGCCHTHHDRDTSILIVLSGSKEVLMAKQNEYFTAAKASENGTFYNLEPFSKPEHAEEKYAWQKIHMGPLTALLIPQGEVHCIKSLADTVAISIPVERAPLHG